MQGLIGCLSIIGYVVCVVATGIWAWNWIDPHSFWGALKFLFVWSISGSIVSGAWSFICGIISEIMRDKY